MPVFRLDLAYDGSGFRGYASQNGQRTIQGELESALKQIFGVEISTTVAGRTDAGVHARNQVVSFEGPDHVDENRLRRSLNGLLKGEVVVVRVSPVDDAFSARFSATQRTYRYRVSVAELPDPLTRLTVWHIGNQIETAAMEATAKEFLGVHDFTAFCRSKQGRSNIRRVGRVEWIHGEDETLDFWVSANAFCHQMVRSMVGLCYDIGRGYISPSIVPSVMTALDRSMLGTVAPPHGLTLWDVSY